MLKALLQGVIKPASLTVGARECSYQVCPPVKWEGVKGDLSFCLAFCAT